MVREDCSKCLYDCNKSLKCRLRKLKNVSHKKQIKQLKKGDIDGK